MLQPAAFTEYDSLVVLSLILPSGLLALVLQSSVVETGILPAALLREICASSLSRPECRRMQLVRSRSVRKGRAERDGLYPLDADDR